MSVASRREQPQAATYSKRLKDSIKSVLDNYGEILKASKVSDETQRVTAAQVAHVENEIEVRAANIVRAAEALSKLVSDLKENLILNDFSTINETTTKRIAELEALQRQQVQQLEAVYVGGASIGVGGVSAGIGGAMESMDITLGTRTT